MATAGLVLAIVLSATGGSSAPPWGQRIAVLEIDGIIYDDTEILDQLREFRQNGSIKGYLVVINSPGGEVGPSQSIYMELKRIRDEDGMPVVAAIGGVGASGGYYVALGADSIYVLPGSLTGSIGVVMEIPQVQGLMERIGIQMEVVKSAEYKDIGSPFRPFGSDERRVLTGLVQDVYSQFVTTVAEERGLTLEEVERLADGRIYSGRQALEAGLVDRIGNVNDALAAVGRMAGLGDDPRIVRPSRKHKISLLDVVLGRATAASLTRLIRPLEQAGGPKLLYLVP